MAIVFLLWILIRLDFHGMLKTESHVEEASFQSQARYPFCHRMCSFVSQGKGYFILSGLYSALVRLFMAGWLGVVLAPAHAALASNPHVPSPSPMPLTRVLAATIQMEGLFFCFFVLRLL